MSKLIQGLDRRLRIEGPFITVWNTGGWIVPSEVFSPDAYILKKGTVNLNLAGMKVGKDITPVLDRSGKLPRRTHD